MTIEQAKAKFRPQTIVEVELLADCVIVANGSDLDLTAVLSDAVAWWSRCGRAIHPRQWRSRVEAARRLLARGNG